VGLLLSSGHAYERVNYSCKMLHAFPESEADRELRELFNVCWHPAGVVEGLPAAPDVQSLPNGRYGNIFDVLVDRPERAKAIFDYPVIWAAGDVDLKLLAKTLDEYVRKGGTLVLTPEAAKQVPELAGLTFTGQKRRLDRWAFGPTVPFEVELAKGGDAVTEVDGVPLAVRNTVGDGAVVTILVPRGLGLDERAHPVLPHIMNGLTAGLLPVDVKPAGEVMYQVNRTKDGFLVALFNNRGVDKTQNGVARVDRRQAVEVVLKARGPVKSAKDWTDPRDLAVSGGEVRVTVHPGDVRVVGFVAR
jgi:hypothetical protein